MQYRRFIIFQVNETKEGPLDILDQQIQLAKIVYDNAVKECSESSEPSFHKRFYDIASEWKFASSLLPYIEG